LTGNHGTQTSEQSSTPVALEMSFESHSVRVTDSTVNVVHGHQYNITATSTTCVFLFLLRRSYEIDSLLIGEHRQRIHQWLSAPDPSSNHNTARAKHQPTTGAWLINGREFAEWKRSPSSFLWLHGGCEFRHQAMWVYLSISCNSGMWQNHPMVSDI
jgi:hypothetical protein